MKTRERFKGRKESGTFAKIPTNVLQSDQYAQLQPRAAKLLLDLCGQYNGINNGKFCCTWSVMSKRGWNSSATLNQARRDLLLHQFIVTTRYGHRHLASLYAVTFLAIDWVSDDGYSDAAVSNIATNLWKFGTSNSESPNPSLLHIPTHQISVQK